LKNHSADQGFPNLVDVTGVAASDIIDYSTNRNGSYQCSPSQRVYMGIMATGYETSAETTVYAPPSYDIGIKKQMYACELSPGS